MKLQPKNFYKDFKLGVLGGGQLGRMLIRSCLDLNVHTFVLDSDPNAPCKGFCDLFMLGNLNDFGTVYQFGKQVDLLTIEIENVNVDALYLLEKEGVAVFPQASVVELVQDKGKQKEFYRKNNIPTADFHLIEHKIDLGKHQSFLPAIQKLRKAGYDGRGVYKLRHHEDIEDAFDAPSVLEKWADIHREISVIVARNANGQMTVFPTVELVFRPKENLVDYLFSPALIDAKTEAKAIEIARTVADKLGIVGLLAVEMFVLNDGDVWVNEIAPRPHNSGHHTMEACHVSQYEQHLRAILNMPLGDTSLIAPALMVNLLGEEGFEGPAHIEGIEKIFAMKGAHLHLYGKKYVKPARKMGHITLCDVPPTLAAEKAAEIKSMIQVISKS